MSKAAGGLTMPNQITIPLIRLEGIIGAVTFLFIALVASLEIVQLQAPAAAAESAPPSEFSSARAMAYVTAIGQKPHPMGVPAHAEVRDYIIEQLNDLGLRTEIQRTTGVTAPDRSVPTAGTVENIIARIPGTAQTKAILLVAHYDSALNGPGASDNGVGVAALIETVRALKAGPPLRNDLLLLISDGEESGLLGASAFIEEHPWASDVGLVLNLGARGNSGPAIVFETGSGNGRLIREFAQAAPQPFASSFFNDIYRFLPNNTDFTEFRSRGLIGFNIAFIEGFLHYHTATDSLENVDQRSLQHHGTYMLALSRHFGALDLTNLRDRDEVYFNLFGTWFVHYPTLWALPLAGVALLVCIIVAVIGVRKKLLTPSGMLLGWLVFLVNLLVAPGVVTLAWSLIDALHPQYGSLPHGEPYNAYVYMAGLVALAVTIISTLYVLFSRKISLPNLTFGGLLWWLIMTVATGLFLPGSSYLFVWPLLFSLAGLGIVLSDQPRSNAFTRRFLVLLLCALPALLLFPPLIYVTYISSTIRLAWVAVAAIVLLFGSLIPHLGLMARPHSWRLPGLALLASASLLVAGNFVSGYDAAHPKPNDIMYALDTDAGKAVLASAEPVQDSWTDQFFPDGGEYARLPNFFPVSPRPLRQTQAPMLPFTPPNVALIDDNTSGDLRTVRLRITTPQNVQLAFIWVDPNTQVVGSLVEGRRVANNQPVRPGSSWGLVYWAPPREGFVLTLEVKPGQPLHIRVVDRIAGLPELPGVTFTPRPKNMMPPPALGTVAQYSDAAMVLKSFTFEAPILGNRHVQPWARSMTR